MPWASPAFANNHPIADKAPLSIRPSYLHYFVHGTITLAKILNPEATCDQSLPTMVDKPPSFCRLCDIALASPEVWRQHLKSEWQ